MILPVFNESIRNLSRSLDSLLSQEFPFRCLIIDESDSQETITFLKNYALKYTNFEYLHPAGRLGLVASLNLGLERCSTKYIARFDSDDINVAERFKKQIAFLEMHRDIAVVGTQVHLINNIGQKVGKRRFPVKHKNIIRNMNLLCPFSHPTVMFNVEALPPNATIKYNDGLKYGEDLDLWLRLADLGTRFANLDEYLLSYRMSDNERSREHWRSNLTIRVQNFINKPKIGKLFGLLVVAVASVAPLELIASLRKILWYRGN